MSNPNPKRENLRSFRDMSESEKRAIQSKGGKISQERAKEARKMSQILETLLSVMIKNSENEDVSTKEAMLTAQVIKAVNGDLSALSFIRDTLGEKPKDEHSIIGDIGIQKVYITEKDKKAVEVHIADVVGEH